MSYKDGTDRAVDGLIVLTRSSVVASHLRAGTVALAGGCPGRRTD